MYCCPVKQSCNAHTSKAGLAVAPVSSNRITRKQKVDAMAVWVLTSAQQYGHKEVLDMYACDILVVRMLSWWQPMNRVRRVINIASPVRIGC